MIKTEKLSGRIRNRSLKDYAGHRFNRLVAIRLLERDSYWNNHVWLFRCDCGAVKAIRIKQVRSGLTVSCGCALVESLMARNVTHGLSRAYPREYKTWKDMRSRCKNPVLGSKLTPQN